MKSGILALVSISSALVSCTSYERPPLFDQIAGKIQGMSGRDDYLSGVGTTSGVNTDLPPEARLGQGYWDLPAGTQGEKHIIIDLKQQKVFYYVGTTLVGVSPMSSGKEGYGTPRGTYKIIQKDANYKSGTYGVLRSKSTGAVVNGDYNARAGGAPAGTYFDPAPMPYWMRITGGYGMHVGFVTGYPVSHGCVRLPEDMAKTFFEHTPIGTKVTIR
ncbi:MAG: L,D-transpeptidase [Akkermansia muciniphila]|uniref:L,D-transpeptidase n=1 Tax=uncultured Akkermansia sp. TaxID=512294 RepID=UPI00261B5F15|nr:L,D-transpeptidase [uncultured Akkermansia sp.]